MLTLKDLQELKQAINKLAKRKRKTSNDVYIQLNNKLEMVLQELKKIDREYANLVIKM